MFVDLRCMAFSPSPDFLWGFPTLATLPRTPVGALR